MRLTDEQIIDVADKHLYKGYLVFAKEVIDEFCRLNNYTYPEPQAQAGEPEVVAEVVSVGTNFATVRPYQQLHGSEKFITMQSHREAMAEQREIEAQLSGQLEATSRSCTEKDAALKACVEVLQEARAIVHEQYETLDRLDAAIQQAKEAMK